VVLGSPVPRLKKDHNWTGPRLQKTAAAGGAQYLVCLQNVNFWARSRLKNPILLQVQAKSSESLLKPLRSKKWLDWPEFCVHWASAGLPMDRGGNKSYCAKCSVYWTSTRHSLDV